MPPPKQIIRTDACLPAGSNRLEFYGRYDDCFARLPVPKAPPPVTGVEALCTGNRKIDLNWFL